MNYNIIISTILVSLFLTSGIQSAPPKQATQSQSDLKRLQQEVAELRKLLTKPQYTCSEYNICLGRTFTGAGTTEAEAKKNAFLTCNKQTQKRVACCGVPKCQKAK